MVKIKFLITLAALLLFMGLPHIYRLIDLYTADEDRFRPIAQSNFIKELYELDFTPPRSGYFEVGLLSEDPVSIETLQALSINGHLKIERGRGILNEVDIDEPLHFRSANNPEIVNKAILFQFSVNTLINNAPLKISYQPESDELTTKFPLIYVSTSAAY